ncbi:MAG: DUF4189 domain-containing protein [Cyanobacteriota bacterium]|nr:DUF4189 domain-containing protein [Cyanobacteriota bacterium]
MNRFSQWMAASVLAVGAVVVGSQQAHAGFGAIAYSPATGSYGYSYNHTTQAGAEFAAVQACSAYAGDCQAQLWFQNSCGALAVSPSGAFGTGWGATVALAQAYAVQTCSQYGGGCYIKYSLCTQ